MDRRKPLQPGNRLPFPGMNCEIKSLAGCGSNALVYLGSYPDEQFGNLSHRVLIKELFPYHPKGNIYRDKNGDIRWKPDAEPVVELHRTSFLKGNEIHIRILEKCPGDIDTNLNTFQLHNTFYSVLGYTGGRSLNKELEQTGAGKIPLMTHIRRLQGVLDVLEAFHNPGFLHLDISPDNILLIGNEKHERVTLIDYNSVHSIEEIKSGVVVYYSAKEGYTAPEVRAGRIRNIGFPSDLYSLAAVFYRCITGKCMTAEQMLRSAAPDLSGAKCLESMPETVQSMVRQILKKGLASLTTRRYQTTEEMRQDLAELQDRIDGKGITHWALWEAGRMEVLRTVKRNSGLKYITDEEHLYPITGMTEDGRAFQIRDLSDFLLSPQGTSAILLGGGGVGKTTALLRVAYAQSPVFTPLEPALTYIPLCDWRPGTRDYMKDRILMGLRFKPETDSLETARHELLRVLKQPISTRAGSRPRLVILLDGLNEITGNAEMLFQEIHELSELEGVRFLMASRSEDAQIPLSKIRLCPLPEEERNRILSEHGLLPPENPELAQLLLTPLMLSVFIQTAEAREKQVFISSRNQLLEYYFEAICSKAILRLQDNSPDRWAIEAALYYVLPEIAAYIRNYGTAVSDRELFPVIEKCYRRLNTRDMLKIFPQWIGHLSDIRGGKTSAEEWYGYIVQDILWYRLGLLVRDVPKRYHIVHQVIEDYLIEIREPFDRKFRRRRNIRIAFGSVLGAVLMAGVYRWLYLPFFSGPREYDINLSETVLDEAVSAYVKLGQRYGEIQKLFCSLEDGAVEECQQWLSEYGSDFGQNNPEKKERAMKEMELLVSSGGVMPWSGSRFNTDTYEALLSCEAEKGKEYLQYIQTIAAARQDPSLWKWRGKEYLEQLEDLAEKDALVLGGYFNTVIAPELDAMEKSSSEKEHETLRYYEDLLKLNDDSMDYQSQVTKEAVEDADKYISERDEAKHLLLQNGLNQRVNEETMGQNVLADEQDEHSEASDHLMTVWDNYLQTKETLYECQMWTYDYVEKYLNTGDWEDLARARLACIASVTRLEDLSMSESDLTAEEYAQLAADGMDTAYQSEEFAALADDIETARKSIREIFLEYLEGSVFLENDEEILKKELSCEKEVISAESRYVCYMTNYLLLQSGDKAYWDSLTAVYPTEYPILSRECSDWISNEDDIMEAAASVLDEIEMVEYQRDEIMAMLDAADYDWDQIYQNNDTELLQSQMHNMSNLPALLPVPVWLDSQPDVTGYIYYYRTENGDVLYPQYGDDLEQIPYESYGVYMRVNGVGRDELLSYLETAADVAETISQEADDKWIIKMPEYEVEAEWKDDAVYFLFLGGDATFAPIWYINLNNG